MTNPLFDQNTTIEIDPTKDYSQELIGEGKKYKDVTAAARALLEKDLFINQIKSENAQMRTQIEQGSKIDDLIDRITKGQPTPTPQPNMGTPAPSANPSEPTNQPKPISQEDILALIEQREKKAQEEANLASVINQVKTMFGANYAYTLSQKAAALNVSTDFLTDVARKNPAAFLKLVEADSPKPNAGAVPTPPSDRIPNNGMNIPNPNATAMNNWKFKDFEALRKKSPSEYFSVAVQNIMFNRTKELGEDFFN